MPRLTERQQLAMAMAESASMAPVGAMVAATPGGVTGGSGSKRRAEVVTPVMGPKTPCTPDGALYGAISQGRASAKRSRVAKELASLAPWAWDPLVGTHAPGPSALRDFSEVVSDKVIVASASGETVTRIQPKTFDRTLLDAKNWAEDKAAKGENEGAVPFEPKTAPETLQREKRRSNRGSAKAEAVTPIALSKTLANVPVTEDKSRRTSGRTTRGTANKVKVTAVPVEANGKENSRVAETQSKGRKESGRSARAALKDATATTMNAATVKTARTQVIATGSKTTSVKKPTPAKKKSKTSATAPKEAKSVQDAPVAPTKSAAPAAAEDKTPMNNAAGEQKLSAHAAKRRQRSLMLETILAQTYVRAIKRPIMPSLKPPQKLLEAYRAFSRACASSKTNATCENEGRSIEFGEALTRGIDILRAEDERAA